MPKTVEVACTAADCDVDMFELHYTSYVPPEEYDATYRCPECGGDSLEPLGAGVSTDRTRVNDGTASGDDESAGADLLLYEQKGCPWCRKVIDHLDERDLDYASVRVDERHSARDQVKRASGQREVPVLVDPSQGVTMSESAKIVEYLDATFGEA